MSSVHKCDMIYLLSTMLMKIDTNCEGTITKPLVFGI